MAWEGERTVTFTMEDALISPVSFSILSGAGLIEAKTGDPIIVHKTEQTNKVSKVAGVLNGHSEYVEITLSEKPYLTTSENSQYNENEDFIYVMVLDDNGEVSTEPYIAVEYDNEVYVKATKYSESTNYWTYDDSTGKYTAVPSNDKTEGDLALYYEKAIYPAGSEKDGYKIRVYALERTLSQISENPITPVANPTPGGGSMTRSNDLSKFTDGCTVLVDYYVAHESGAYQIDITPDKFGGNFYLEASTLFRAENGQDMPAEFIIPNCKIQSNFTFSMASSGDPSTFTFTMDAFPDYTRWNKEKKVFAAIQVINTGETNSTLERLGTGHDYTGLGNENPYATYLEYQKPFIELD